MGGWGGGYDCLPHRPLPTPRGAAAVRDNLEETRGSRDAEAFLGETCRCDEAAVPRGKARVACAHALVLICRPLMSVTAPITLCGFSRLLIQYEREEMGTRGCKTKTKCDAFLIKVQLF